MLLDVIDLGFSNIIDIYGCDSCGLEILEHWPHFYDNQFHYCLNCGISENIDKRFFQKLKSITIKK